MMVIYCNNKIKLDQKKQKFLCMSSFIKATPLQVGSVQCNLLQIDDFCILLDCGWIPPFNVKDLDLLREIAPKVAYCLIIGMPITSKD